MIFSVAGERPATEKPAPMACSGSGWTDAVNNFTHACLNLLSGSEVRVVGQARAVALEGGEVSLDAFARAP